MQIYFILLKFDAEHTGHDKVAYLLIIKSALVAQTHKKLCRNADVCIEKVWVNSRRPLDKLCRQEKAHKIYKERPFTINT